MIPRAGTPVAHVAQTLGPPSDLHKCPVAQALPEIFWAKGTKPQVRGGGPWPTPTGRARAHTHAPARPREAVPSATRKGTEMQQAIPSPEGVVSILLDNGEIIDIQSGSLDTSSPIGWVATTSDTYRTVLITSAHVSLVEYEFGTELQVKPAIR